MKKYKVTIYLMLPHQDSVDQPKTKKAIFNVEAENSHKAYKEAEKLNESLLSIWDYKVELET
jgi:hypothetical protein